MNASSHQDSHRRVADAFPLCKYGVQLGGGTALNWVHTRKTGAYLLIPSCLCLIPSWSGKVGVEYFRFTKICHVPCTSQRENLKLETISQSGKASYFKKPSVLFCRQRKCLFLKVWSTDQQHQHHDESLLAMQLIIFV